MQLGQEKTLRRLKEWFYWPGHFVMFTIGVSPASAVLLEKLLSLDKELPLRTLLVGTPCRP